jgi:hypothetical protein
MFKTITNSLLLGLLFGTVTFAQERSNQPMPKRISGCALLAHPGRYTGKLVEVVGTIHVGFEASNMTFSCPGNVGISFSLYDPDLKKYGFLTEPESKKALDAALGESYPGEIVNDRKTKSVTGTVVGLFRCHYDFPTCEDITRFGDSSIVVRSARLGKLSDRAR